MNKIFFNQNQLALDLEELSITLALMSNRVTANTLSEVKSDLTISLSLEGTAVEGQTYPGVCIINFSSGSTLAVGAPNWMVIPVPFMSKVVVTYGTVSPDKDRTYKYILKY
jgi:hypothetical protein